MISDANQRAAGAIAGLFIGDALAMPVHWYYDTERLLVDYGRVTHYLAPKNPHPDSILWRSRFPSPGRGFDILHDQRQYWGTPGIHYHQFLKAGENTLNLQCARLLMDVLEENAEYRPEDYLTRYIDFMTTPGRHRDTYVEEFHRHFFTRLAAGHKPHHCGIPEKHIGGLAGIVPLLVHYRNDPPTAASAAATHLSLTHRGPRMETAAAVILDLLLPVLGGENLKAVIESAMNRQGNPLLGHPYRKWLQQPDARVVGGHLSPACYVEDAVSAVIYLAYKYADDPATALMVNTHLGGDNAHRGAILGALVGAANGIDGFPREWVTGLRTLLPDQF
jgi:ADP-ribosylglycohydrolase